MNGAVRVGEQARIRRFIALHIAAVGLIYGAALGVGAGLRSTPVPSGPVVVARAEPGLQVADALARTMTTTGDPVDAVLPGAQPREIAQPWSVDAHGRVLLRDL